MKEFVKKKAVIVKDRLGLPNYMTMFYMEPGTYNPEDVPEMFKIRNKIVPAILISQYHNTTIKSMGGDVAVSLPYQQPRHTITLDEAAAACARKGEGWHLMTNTEFVYLLHEAEELGRIIGGNTNHGSNADNPQEKGVVYDSAGRTLTGCDPLTWSHDGTAGGVFGICGNFWEFVTGLRLHKGVVEYTKDNDAAVEGYKDEAPDWTVAEVNGKRGYVNRRKDRKGLGWLPHCRIAAGRVGRRAGNCVQAGNCTARLEERNSRNMGRQ